MMFLLTFLASVVLSNALKDYLILPGVSSVRSNSSNRFRGSFRNISRKKPIDDSRSIIEVSENVFKDLSSAQDMRALEKMLGILNEPKGIFRESRLSFAGRPSFPRANSRERKFDLSKFNSTNATTTSFKSKNMEQDNYLSNPSQAHCEPEVKPVDLGLTNTNEIIYYPTCVRIKQCGGCCPKKSLFSCQPIATKKILVKVLKIVDKSPEKNEITRSARMKKLQTRRRRRVKVQYDSINVTVEEHTDCNCLCKLKESTCNPAVHLYDNHSCACVCKNSDEEEKCFMKRTHYWASDLCQCNCRKVFSCSSNQEFDHKSCSCRLKNNGLTWNGIFGKSPPSRVIKSSTLRRNSTLPKRSRNTLKFY